MSVDQIEMALRPPETPMVPYPPKYVDLKDGRKLVIHQVGREAVPTLLKVVEPLIKREADFYDIVAARVYSELLGFYRYRVKDEFVLVGTIDGVVAGLVNQRMVDQKTAMSYHTLAVKRGLRVGPALFAAKMEYSLDYLGQEEVLIVAESPHGLRRWMQEYDLIPRFDTWHELGGGPSFVLTKELWEKKKAEKNVGIRPVPQELLETAKKLIIPNALEV
ncbi:hypothetical protein [Candidatus Formimonas warabiya]|uniref:N-acetyltransferase domain-containing protein n=1 Tax=Formimonas warabiya TaxID=1761012 RepID=A0A3G1KZF3_FORW1|nr:hypothetical protein [Candidatus Formimonas warabiya]ATW27764.1 hypothetical protein DCMF_26115 [Candidatus Formimonas warabiya]